MVALPVSASIISNSDPEENNLRRRLDAVNRAAVERLAETVKGLDEALRNKHQTQLDLIRWHMEAGRRMIEIRRWFSYYMPDVPAKVFEPFVFNWLQYPYSRRSAQRDRKLYTSLRKYVDLLETLEQRQIEVTLRGIYSLSGVQGDAFQMVIGILERVASLPEGSAQTIQSLTEKQVAQIVETAKVVEQAPELVREEVKAVIQRAGVTDPETARALVKVAKSNPDMFEEIKKSEHATLPIGDGGEPEQVHVSRLGAVGARFLTKEDDLQAALRHQDEIIERAREKASRIIEHQKQRREVKHFVGDWIVSDGYTEGETPESRIEQAIALLRQKALEQLESGHTVKIVLYSNQLETPNFDPVQGETPDLE